MVVVFVNRVIIIILVMMGKVELLLCVFIIMVGSGFFENGVESWCCGMMWLCCCMVDFCGKEVVMVFIFNFSILV